MKELALFRRVKVWLTAAFIDVTKSNWGWRLENSGRTKDYRADLVLLREP